MSICLDVSRVPRDLRQKRWAEVFRRGVDRERWDIDAGGTEANDVHAFGQTGRETTAVLAGRCGRSPTATSARARVTEGGRRSNSEILRARCAERQNDRCSEPDIHPLHFVRS